MRRIARALTIGEGVLLAICLCLALQALAARPSRAQTLQPFSPAGIERIHREMQQRVDRGDTAGIVTLIGQGNRILDLAAFGFQDIGTHVPMQTTSLFRIASMSKAITSAAILMLRDQGRLRLSDPVSRFIPGFAPATVLRSDGSVEATNRPITIEDLLAHRSGLTYAFNGDRVSSLYERAGISDGLASTGDDLATTMEKLGSLPLLAQPGKTWVYSLSSDVLGRVIEVASGESLDAFLRKRLFTPLRMTDTGFAVPDAKWSRLAAAYTTADTGGLCVMNDPQRVGLLLFSPTAYYRSTKTLLSGGAGLVSTADDYWRFLRMLLNGGRLGGVRLLTSSSVSLMTSSHTSDLSLESLGGLDFGFGVGVVTPRAATGEGSGVGSYLWSGVYGTSFWVDPARQLIGIFLEQRNPGSGAAQAFERVVYEELGR